MSSEMSLREHLDEMRSRIIRIVVSVIIITIFSMSFGIKTAEVDFFGLQNYMPVLYFPFPDPYDNVSIQLTRYMHATLLPPEVKLIQTAPGQAFFAQIYVSLLVGVIASMPVIIREIYSFISPAISKKTKNIGLYKVFLPALLLFVSGILLSYLLVIPFTLDFLYRYGEAIDVSTFLTINDFISFVLQFFLGFGIAFELPIVMYAISLTGMLDAKFWRNNFRYALLILVVFGAIITPDGSGVTMWFIAVPMMALYIAGMIAIERREKGRKTQELGNIL